MKKLWFFNVVVIFLFISCNEDQKRPVDKENTEEMAYNSFGDEISLIPALSSAEMQERYKDLSIGDSISVSFKTTVNTVCKKKGCWMTLDLPEEEDVMVTFKDYGFFVPKDIEQKEAIVKGKAYIAEVSVEEQKHYAKDKGKTDAEIATIKQPKRTLSFLADGVLLKE